MTDTIVIVRGRTQVITVGRQGVPGVPGPSGGSTVSRVAEGPVGGHRIVYATLSGRVAYADAANLAHLGRVVGMTTQAAVDGDLLAIAVCSVVEDAAWTWVPGTVYLGSNGLPTQLPPTSGFLQPIGTTLDATHLLIGLKSPIVLT